VREEKAEKGRETKVSREKAYLRGTQKGVRTQKRTRVQPGPRGPRDKANPKI